MLPITIIATAAATDASWRRWKRSISPGGAPIIGINQQLLAVCFLRGSGCDGFRIDKLAKACFERWPGEPAVDVAGLSRNATLFVDDDKTICAYLEPDAIGVRNSVKLLPIGGVEKVLVTGERRGLLRCSAKL